MDELRTLWNSKRCMNTLFTNSHHSENSGCGQAGTFPLWNGTRVCVVNSKYTWSHVTSGWVMCNTVMAHYSMGVPWIPLSTRLWILLIITEHGHRLDGSYHTYACEFFHGAIKTSLARNSKRFDSYTAVIISDWILPFLDVSGQASPVERSSFGSTFPG